MVFGINIEPLKLHEIDFEQLKILESRFEASGWYMESI